MLIRGLAARHAATEELFRIGSARLTEGAQLMERKADAARRSPWFADSVVDIDAARRRAGLDGHFLDGTDHLDVPNPFFVLPTEAIVRWGFATGPQVEAAYRIARNGTEPIRWRNPPLMRELGWMGWDQVESVARIGLVLGEGESGSPTAGRPATTPEPSIAGLASPTTWTAPERQLAALGYPQVARFVHALGRLGPAEMSSLEGRVAGHSIDPDVFAITDTIRGKDEQDGLWPLTSSAVEQQPTLASASQHLQAVTVVAGLALSVKWDLAPETWIRAWRPFAEPIPFSSVWAADTSEPLEFQSQPAVDALARLRRSVEAELDRTSE